MTAQTNPLRWMIAGPLCFGLLAVSIACADGQLPTSPTRVDVAAGSALATSSSATSSAMARPSDLLLTKTCSPDSPHCTVETSDFGPVPAGTDIFYTGPLLDARTTSGIILTTPGGDTAKGHCSLSYRSFTGTCVITGGTGALSGLHAQVKVTGDFANPQYPAGLFTWEGTYRFAPTPPD